MQRDVRRRIPLWLKALYTAFVAAIVPVYARQYGWRNFLWFSDIALLLTTPALWLERPLLASMQAVSVTVPETLSIPMTSALKARPGSVSFAGSRLSLLGAE